MSAGISSHQFHFCKSYEDAAEHVTLGCRTAEKLLMVLAGPLQNWQPPVVAPWAVSIPEPCLVV